MVSSSESKDDSAPKGKRLTLRRKLAFSVITVVVFFVGLEAALRLIGFRTDTSVERMEFTFPIDDYNQNSPQPFLQRDEVLFWRPRAGVLGHNAHGFYGPEFSTEKPAGVYRIVCLGDSCTHFGPHSYPDILRAILDKNAPGKFEVISAGVIGYTSYQGKTLLESQVVDWSPDLVTVYFGWNDHWLARGVEDKNQTAPATSDVVNALDSLRLFQLVRMLRSSDADRIAKMRVEVEDYRDNLNKIAETCRTSGIETWYLTAPHALDLGIPPYLLTSGEILDPAGLIPLHQSYNDVVRDVSQKRQATLLDFDAEMNQMDKYSLFIDDHIHLSQQGRLYVAQRLYQTLQERGIVSAEAESKATAD